MMRSLFIFNFKHNQGVWKLVVKAFCFIVVFFVIDQVFFVFKYDKDNVFASIAKAKVKQMESHLFAFKNRGHPDEVVVMGSSHYQLGIDTDLISRELKRSSYNLAFGGGTYVGDQLLLLEAYLKLMGKPRLIVYGMDSFDLVSSPYDAYSAINDILDRSAIVDMKRGKDKWLKAIPLGVKSYCYGRNLSRFLQECANGNCTLPYWRKGDADLVDQQPFSWYGGYDISETGFVKGRGLPNTYRSKGKIEAFKLREDHIEKLSSLIRFCQEQRIRIIFVQAPEHEAYIDFKDYKEPFKEWMKAFAVKTGVSYYDFNNSQSFPVANNTLFFDLGHLNVDGALFFTKKLLPIIKDNI